MSEDLHAEQLKSYIYRQHLQKHSKDKASILSFLNQFFAKSWICIFFKDVYKLLTYV